MRKLILVFSALFCSTAFSGENVDLLFVIDSSPSMKQERLNLGSKLESIYHFIQDKNWRIAVTTTDPADAPLIDVISSGEENVRARFNNAVNVGSAGTFKERGILRAVEALRAPFGGQSWVREWSKLYVVIVSDEDNCSHDSFHCRDESDADTDYLMDYLWTIRTPGVDAKVFGMIWHPSVSQSDCSTGYNQAHTYASLIRQTSGEWMSICETDFTAGLMFMSKEWSR